MATWDELTALRPGAAVRHGDAEYVIERTIRLEQDGGVWFEHRLSSDASGRTVWLEIPADPAERVTIYDSSEPLGAPHEPGPEIVHEGERMPHVMSGPATYRTIERSAAAKSGVLEYHEYAAGGRHVTYECRGAEGLWEVSEGREADPAEIEILG